MTDVNSIVDTMMNQSQIRFSILGTTYRVAVERFHASEQISSCFTIDLSLVSEDEIKDPAEIIEKEALLTISGDPSDRYFHGVINNFVLTGRNGRFYSYQTTVVPLLWFLNLNQDCRIFQSQTVPDIVKEILKDNKIDTDHYEFRLKDKEKYKKRRNCVQYRETDLGFISRLLEEEGVYYFFEHSKDKHLLVFGDSTVAYKPIEEPTTIKYKSGGGMVASEESISDFSFTQTVCSGMIIQSAYNFKKPSLGQETKEQGKTYDKYEIYDYPHNYGYPDDGRRLAKIRLEEQKTSEQMASGASNCCRLLPGHTFKLTGHDFSALDKEYLMVTVEHNGSQSHVLGEQSGMGGDFHYDNSFKVIPSSVTLRPGISKPKPIVPGMQSATVVGPENEEIYVDEHGRVKVQFHWDRKGKKDEKSSCWLRCVQTWGGGGWGSVFIPRVGDEVLVDFMEGDPDWPIITGSVYNVSNPPLYDLPANKTRSTIKTKSYPNSNGFNELRFEDKAGQEEVYLQGEKDWNILIKHDKGQNVGHDETLTVVNNRTKTVGVNQMETIGVNKTITVGANHTENIGANMNLTVTGLKNEVVALTSTESVGLAKVLTVGAGYAVTVVGAMNTGVGLGQFEEIGLTKQVRVGKNLEFSAGDNVTITCGKSKISMDKDGNITISGAKLELNGSDHVQVNGETVDIN